MYMYTYLIIIIIIIINNNYHWFYYDYPIGHTIIFIASRKTEVFLASAMVRDSQI